MSFSIDGKSQLDYYTVSHSHMYWGRKHFNGLRRIFETLEEGDILLDPFCGAGTPIIIGLERKARVIATDLNPMAVFLSKALVTPVSLFSLEQCFEKIAKSLAEEILSQYKIECPTCKKHIYFDYVQWHRLNDEEIPNAVKFSCEYCSGKGLKTLTKEESAKQISLSKSEPKFWFPKRRIRARRKTRVDFFHELFTGRNLSALSALYDAISRIRPSRSRQTLLYVFTAMLYSCSKMQMFSSKAPSSSRGWTAPRFYLPPKSMEKNVWKAFEARFKNVLKSKAKLNQRFGAVTISNSLDGFKDSNNDIYIGQADYLSFKFPSDLKVSHVFIDPPYHDDVDYLGFSEFWGCWLDMDFPIKRSWRLDVLSLEERSERIYKLLERIRKNTENSCNVTLAYGSKKGDAWKPVEEAILKAGYQIQDKIPILFDNSQKRKHKDFGPTDLYLILKRIKTRSIVHDKAFRVSPNDIAKTERLELKSFLRLATFLLSFENKPKLSNHEKMPNPEMVRDRANQLIRPALREKLAIIPKKEIIEWTSEYSENRKAYNTLCLAFLCEILSKDGFKIKSLKSDSFDFSFPHFFFDTTKVPNPKAEENGADFVAIDEKGSRLIFCFFKIGREKECSKIAQRVINKDKGKFELSHFLIFPLDDDNLQEYRQVGSATIWPRGFLLTFPEIIKRLKVLDPDSFSHFSLFLENSISDLRSKQKISLFTAEVESNFPVDDNDINCRLFRIKFKAPELSYIVPGQFVMIDPLQSSKRKRSEGKTNRNLKNLPSEKNLEHISYLKRPFSIHRAFYQHFKFGYLKNISLPPNLAPITHTIFPNRFEIFYKVLENGIGTKELKELKEGDKLKMLGPLGKISGLSGLRSNGIEEVHLVGGGVGMAPLIFFGQALKFYSFKVKAFIGIESIETLRFSSRHAPTFSEDKDNAYAYIENLSNIGIDLDDIFISTEQDYKSSSTFTRLGEDNYHVGFVTEQYEEDLIKRKDFSGLSVIACGPGPMLRRMHKITSEHNIPMQILMEKRMACGIGVCMSCVCRTKKGATTQYSRVCTDGPLLNSDDIDWERI